MRQPGHLQFSAIIILTALFAGPALAAVGDHQWSQGFGTGGAADVDGTGAVASSGMFGSATSWGGPTLTPLGPNGDMYLVRHDTGGGHLWSKQFTPDGFMSVSQVAADENGNMTEQMVVKTVMVREATLQMGWCLNCHKTHPSVDENYGEQAELRRAELKDCWTCHK